MTHKYVVYQKTRDRTTRGYEGMSRRLVTFLWMGAFFVSPSIRWWGEENLFSNAIQQEEGEKKNRCQAVIVRKETPVLSGPLGDHEPDASRNPLRWRLASSINPFQGSSPQYNYDKVPWTRIFK